MFKYQKVSRYVCKMKIDRAHAFTYVVWNQTLVG